MPFYDYMCEDCGPFTERVAMADFDKPCDCPDCGASAKRVLLQAPTFANMDSARKVAFSTNEKSRHEPKSTRTHGPGCGCCSGKAKSGRTLHRPDGSKSFPTARPWMISH